MGGGVWPAFFEWQAQGASFAIVELDVTAGADVAYAFAHGRWVVAHEHHSFALLT